MRRPPFVALAIALSLTILGCSDDPAEQGAPAEDTGTQDAADAAPDTADDTGSPDAADADGGGVDSLTDLERTPAQPGLSPDGHPDVSEALGSGEVRAGRITGDAGFRGAWAHCRTGDFKLYNRLIEVCIQAESTNRYELFTGGKIVDARRVGADGEEVLDGLMPMIGLGTVRVDRVEVIREGSNGGSTAGSAVIRTYGTDTAIAHLVGVLGRGLIVPQDLEVTTEYRLDPESTAVEIVSWYYNPNDSKRAFFVGDWFAWGDRAELWVSGKGFGQPVGTYRWLAGQGPNRGARRSHGWVAEAEASGISLLDRGIPWAASRIKDVSLEANQEDGLRRWFIVGDGSIDSVRQVAHELIEAPLGGQARTITVTAGPGGQPVADRQVVLFDAEGNPVAGDRTGAAGTVTLTVPDATYEARVEHWLGSESVSQSVDLGGQAATVALADPATLELTVTDEAGAPLAALVQISGAPRPITETILPGAHRFRLEPGDYEVVVSHGPEFDYASRQVQLAAGQTEAVTVSLAGAMDTDGWLSGDFHQHMEPSLDSAVHVVDRVRDNAAVGVELFAATDHEVVTDLAPVITELGLDGVVQAFPGVEISPLETHMGMYPMRHDRDLRGWGTIELAVLEDGEPVKRIIPEIVQIARGLDIDPVVQLNHSRRDSSGMLELVGFDPELGPEAVDDRRFTTDFDTMEVINRFANVCKLFADWSGLLNYGLTPTGLGNSDAHGIGGSSGIPRNFVHLDRAVGEVTEDDLRDAMRAGRVTVGANAFIDLTDGKVPGDTITVTAGDRLDFGVRIQTPNFSQADRLVAVVNGQVVDSFDMATAAADHVDFDEPVALGPFDADSWVVFFAWGPRVASPLPYGEPVIAFTNPVFVDVGGDGYTAPGLQSLNLSAIDPLCQ